MILTAENWNTCKCQSVHHKSHMHWPGTEPQPLLGQRGNLTAWPTEWPNGNYLPVLNNESHNKNMILILNFIRTTNLSHLNVIPPYHTQPPRWPFSDVSAPRFCINSLFLHHLDVCSALNSTTTLPTLTMLFGLPFFCFTDTGTSSSVNAPSLCACALRL